MSWSTSNEYCGTCRSWKGERQVKRVSDRVVAVFPHANERGRCVEKNDTRLCRHYRNSAIRASATNE